jgi:hypothetical protein
MQFPVYIKHRSGEVYYAILSDESFIELKKLSFSNSDKYMVSEIIDGDFSTRIYISDLLQMLETGALMRIEEKEFAALRGLSQHK